MLPSPNLIHYFLRPRKFSKNSTKRFLYEVFWQCETKKYLTENRDTPSLPLFIHKFFRYQNFCEKQKTSWTKYFGTMRNQFFHRKSWSSPLRHEIFRYPKVSKTQKGSPTKWIGSVRQNNFFGKWQYPLSLFALSFFDIRIFLKHRKVPLQNFSALWDKNFSTEKRDTLLQKVQILVEDLMFVKTLWKLNSKQ